MSYVFDDDLPVMNKPYDCAKISLEKDLKMPVDKIVAKDDPLWIAWEHYKKTSDYAPTKYWARKVEHTEGALWAAFSSGYLFAKNNIVDFIPDNIKNE